MSAEVIQTNKDGLTRRYGVQATDDSRPKTARAKVIEELVIDFGGDDITTASGVGFYDADASGGTVPDSFSEAVGFIPAGSTIIDAFILATVAVTGTGVVDIGLENKAGSALNADGIFDGIDIDDAAAGLATVGASLIPNGINVVKSSGTYDPDGTAAFATEDMYVRPILESGTWTAGSARLVVTYLAP